jgi:Fe-Mn family superoxide dismutase
MKEEMTRRLALNLGLSAAGIAVASCAAPADARPTPTTAAAPQPLSLLAAPAQKQLVPLPFDATKFEGLSEQLLTSHHHKNYAGAVKKLNLIRGKLGGADVSKAGSYWSEYGTLKAGEAGARNSALLHELYFANMIGGGNAVPVALGTALASRFGSLDAAVELMRGCAKATGGWVILAIDRTSRTIELVQTDGHRGGAWHAEALIVLDVFEHSYAIDYGPNKGGYLDAFFKNVHWVEVGRRFDAALV